MAAAATPSPALLEANRRLYQRRQEIRATRDVDEAARASGDPVPPWAPAADASPVAAEETASLPPHLG